LPRSAYSSSSRSAKRRSGGGDKTQGDDEPATVLSFDPLADMMLSLAAIVVVALLALLPLLPARPAAPRQEQTAAAKPDEFSIDGLPLTPFIATPRGILHGPTAAELVPLDRILDDRALAADLARHRSTGIRVALLIHPNGSEAAFLFETVAYAYGPAAIRQIRLNPGCAYPLASAVARFCVEAPRRGEGLVR
jgi:hypothetical protein